MTSATTTSPYTLLLLTGVAVSLGVWLRLGRREPKLVAVYFGALLGAFTGAKVVYLAAEGWLYCAHPDRWLIWATGKTIVGALLGGYLGVEVAKEVVGYRAPTGDLFALTAPVGIVLGRIGCLLHGCCLGQECAPGWWTLTDREGHSRWPAVPVEIGFNLIMAGSFLIMRRARLLPGQHFHVYLMAYGAFRFAHEFARDTPRILLGLSGYQIAALGCVALGWGGYVQRERILRATGI